MLGELMSEGALGGWPRIRFQTYLDLRDYL